ncbi:helix-turn-helix transcriptional regulator [Thermogemmatispora sp.]|uniref:helix-turn-helix transcriptional regulator n=1 Tax=Thermogemmatispora sp. TaxID=1968838 RepID=UPI0035E414D2
MKVSFDTPVLCPVCIGRADHLTALCSAIDQARSGKGCVVLISGEAGIGKTRLLAEAKATAAAQSFLILQGNCFPTDNSYPYAPLLDLLRSFLASNPAAADSIPVLFSFFPDMLNGEGSTRLSAPLSGQELQIEKHRLFTSLTQFLLERATDQPVVFILEDIHWSDDNSLEYLYYLARSCASRPLLVLLTYRSDEVSPALGQLLAHLDRERLAREISLPRLTHSEMAAMLRAIFTSPHVAQLDSFDPIYTLAEGNPFFVEELLKSLIASEDIFYIEGRWHCKPLSKLSIPRSVQHMVQQRAGRLSEQARQILVLAAVIGHRFDFALLQVLTPHDESRLLALIKELITAQLVVEESEERFAFRHALTWQAIYSDLLIRERKSLHRSIAEAIERLSASSEEASVADLAYHFYEGGVWEKALEYGQRAGEKAQAMYAPRAAIEQFTRALDALGHLRRMASPQIYLARGQAYEILGDFEQACSDYEMALERARSLHDRSAEWQSLIALGFLWAGRDYARTGIYYQQALVLARHIGDARTIAHSLNRLGNWHLNIEQPAESLRCHQEALAAFQAENDQQGLAETLDLLGMAYYLNGEMVQGIACNQQAVALFRRLDDRRGLVFSLGQLTLACGLDMAGSTALVLSFGEAFGAGEEALRIARETGQHSAEAFVLFNMSMLLATRGEYAQAWKFLQEGLGIVEQIEHRQWLIFGSLGMGWYLLDLLDPPEAQRRLERALTLAHESGSVYWMRVVSGFLALACLAERNMTRAASVLDAVLEPGAPMQTTGQRVAWYARAELALAQGDPGTALHIIDGLISSNRNLSAGQSDPRFLKLRGEALVALRREAEAEAMLCAAREAACRQVWRPLLWRIDLALGKLYRAKARQQEAEQAFSAARALIEELAADVPHEELRAHFLSQALALLPQKGAVRRLSDGLTSREREVAILVAQGKSNREIADLLVVGLRTVEAHVSNILCKLNFTSRAQVAIWAHEKGLLRREK